MQKCVGQEKKPSMSKFIPAVWTFTWLSSKCVSLFKYDCSSKFQWVYFTQLYLKWCMEVIFMLYLTVLFNWVKFMLLAWLLIITVLNFNPGLKVKCWLVWLYCSGVDVSMTSFLIRCHFRPIGWCLWLCAGRAEPQGAHRESWSCSLPAAKHAGLSSWPCL